MKKVLFLAYYFPPAGGAGVQRTVKFMKYLPQFGYDSIVAAGDGFIKVGPKDSQLSREVADIPRYNVEINGFERFRKKIISSKIGKRLATSPMGYWLPAAVRTMAKAVEEQKPDVIFATVSPFIAAKAAMIVSKKYDIPWVLDMRDPWALDPINFYPTKLHYLTDLKNMTRACVAADAVIANTPSSLEAVKNKIPGLDTKKCFYITNGFDSDDFDNIIRQNCQGPLNIVHTGLFHTRLAMAVNPWAREILHKSAKKFTDKIRFNIADTNLMPRTPYYLFKAARLLLDSGKIVKNDITFTFAGDGTAEDRSLAEIFDLSDIVNYTGYVNHSKSIEYLLSSDVLFLPLHKPKNCKPLIVPGKTYEYMASGKPILAAVPDGDCRDFIQNYDNGSLAVCDDYKSIADAVYDFVQRKRNGQLNTSNCNTDFVNQFSRQNITSQLADVLNSITS